MAVEASNTNMYQKESVKMVIYGEAGIGKTPIATTAPRPLIIDVEGRLRSVRNKEIPVLRVRTWKDFKEAIKIAQTPEWMDIYDTLIVDSISEIAELYLQEMKEDKAKTNMQKNYGDMADAVIKVANSFKDTWPIKHVILIAKGAKEVVADKLMYSMNFPGKELPKNMPFIFDEVLLLRNVVNQEGQLIKVFQTFSDGTYFAKDSSTTLEPYETLNLTYLIDKIQNGEMKTYG